MAPASRHSAHVHWQAPGLSVGTLCACQAEALILGWASQTQLGQGSSRRPPGGRPPPGMAHACLTSHQIARRGSPELPAQLLEEKADGEEAQGGRGGEHASAVVLQVPPQAAGEGLWGRGLEAQNLRTTWVREKVGPPPPSIGLHFPRNGHLGHMRTPSPARSPSPLQAPPPGQLHQQSGPCRSWAAGLCAQTPTPSGSLAVQATGVLRTPVSGAVPRSMAPVQLTYFQELAGALQSKRQAPRRLLSCPPSLTVNTAVLSGFPSALPAPLRPILESEPRHITPAALLRCPSAEGPAQCLRSPSGHTPPHSCPLSWGPAQWAPTTRLSGRPGSVPRQGDQAARAPSTPQAGPRPQHPAQLPPTTSQPQHIHPVFHAVIGQARHGPWPPFPKGH